MPDEATQRTLTRIPARAGLVGNPSDGYGGRVVAVAVDNYAAEVELTPCQGVSITPARHDQAEWDSLPALLDHSERYGYRGGGAIIQAALAAYAAFLDRSGRPMPDAGFRLAYRTSVPRQVGLAGSSAIALAALRAVADFHRVKIEPILMPSLALAAEKRLGIVAGLQDRVVQHFGGVVSMDFRVRRMRTEHGLAYGEYRFLDPSGLPPLYLAWSEAAAAESNQIHAGLRDRFLAKEWVVVSGMKMLSGLAEQAEEAVRQGDHRLLASLIDESFNVRSRMVELPPTQAGMVDRARAAGASATFAGSGGAIVGSYSGIDQLNDLQARLEPLDATVVRVSVAPEFAGAGDHRG